MASQAAVQKAAAQAGAKRFAHIDKTNEGQNNFAKNFKKGGGTGGSNLPAKPEAAK